MGRQEFVSSEQWAHVSVDSADTVASALRPSGLKPLWRVLRSWPVLLSAAVGIVCAQLALVGVLDETALLGWLAACALPSALACLLFSNTALLFFCLTSFPFWFAFLVVAVRTGCLAQAVAYDAPRVFALAVLGLADVALVLMDARVMGNAKSFTRRWGAVLMAAVNAPLGTAFCFLYAFGVPKMQPGVVTEAGMMMTVLGVLGQWRALWLVYASPHAHPLVVLYAPLGLKDPVLAPVDSFAPEPVEAGLSRRASMLQAIRATRPMPPSSMLLPPPPPQRFPPIPEGERGRTDSGTIVEV